MSDTEIVPEASITEMKMEKPAKHSHHLVLKIVLILVVIFAAIVSCMMAGLLLVTHDAVLRTSTSSSSSTSIASSSSSESSNSSSSSSVSSATVKQYVSFNSTRYNMYFEYPVEMGDATVVYRPDLFNDEIISFANSKLTIQYWRDELGFEAGDTSTATSADGKTFIINTLTSSSDPSQYSIFGIDSSHKVYLLVQGLSASEKTTYQDLEKDIISTMRFTAP